MAASHDETMVSVYPETARGGLVARVARLIDNAGGIVLLIAESGR